MDLDTIIKDVSALKKFLPMLESMYADWNEFQKDHPGDADRLRAEAAAEIYAPLHDAPAAAKHVDGLTGEPGGDPALKPPAETPSDEAAKVAAAQADTDAKLAAERKAEEDAKAAAGATKTSP